MAFLKPRRVLPGLGLLSGLVIVNVRFLYVESIVVDGAQAQPKHWFRKGIGPGLKCTI